MGKADYYKAGSFNAICSTCGFKFKSTKMKTDYYGNIVCSGCYDPRHPQEFVRGTTDEQKTPWVSPEAPDTFVPEVAVLIPINN